MLNRVKIIIKGNNPNYFFKEIVKKRINIYYLEKHPKHLILVIDYNDYLSLLKIKTTYKIKILSYYGTGKVIHYIKKYIYLILLFIIGVIINIFLSRLIFDVDIVHSNKKLSNIIEKDLKELGISKYRFKVNYKQKEKIKEKILKKEKDILEWLEIDENGNKYIIKLEERKKNKENNTCSPRNLVSKKNAVITKIKSSSGEIIKKKNDYVSKGTVIISGLIHNKEDIVSKRCATGEVYGETWYTVKVLINSDIKKTKLLNKKDLGINIVYFNKKYTFFNNIKNYKKNSYNIIDSRILPINLSICTYQEKKTITKPINDKVLKKKAIDIAKKKLEKQLSLDDTIISEKILKKSEKNSKIEIDVFLSVEENITDYVDISELNIEELNKRGD